ncbi:MAG: hypothetical protein H8D34_30605 [Chloroflexi bacterium]|nr:hypothetical protein [Chloroflexota bacterium]MBL7163365.1 hypothetical protein [Anaerolineales bacterium]
MRRGRVFFYLAAILILVLVAAFVISQRVLQPSGADISDALEPTPVVDLVDVVVITQPTPRGTVLYETILGTIEMPRDVVIEGMFTDMALVVGRQAKFDLDSGIPLTASMLVDAADQLSARGSLAALSIPRGMVAVSIPISRLSSVSYAPKAGDHVSVIASMLFLDLDSEFQTELPNHVRVASGPYVDSETGQAFMTIAIEKPGVDQPTAFPFYGRTELDPILNELVYVVPGELQRSRLVTQMMFYDVEILQVGDFPLVEEEAAPAAAAAVDAEVAAAEAAAQAAQPQGAVAEEPEPVIPPDVITIIVTPQDAVTVNYLLFSGAELTLALRSSRDDSITTTEAATLQFLLDVYNIPIPAKLPYGMEPRIDELVPPTLGNDSQPAEQ